jgi:hypothetical protein
MMLPFPVPLSAEASLQLNIASKRRFSFQAANCAALCLALLTMNCGCQDSLAEEPNLAESTKSAVDSKEADARLFDESPLVDSDRDHWSFQPIKRPELPAVAAPAWCRTAIDRFIVAKLENARLPPAPMATRRDWLRRVKLDLLGLPPTPDEIADFQADGHPDADARIIDRWLASPRFGERWAQHWLDLARFAETDGFEHDKVRENAWEYRDWVIAALNGDMPYDEFVRLQLAGDQSENTADRIATMFCLASSDMPDINNQELRRHDRLNELTSAVGSTLLGLQMHCAQCHDHKYDPISQADFYRLRAVFEVAVPELKRDKPFNVFEGDQRQSSARFYFRGELNQPGAKVQPAVPRIGVDARDALPQLGSNPRLQFSQWLFAEKNPFTARIIVNRLWQHLFGRGLMESPSDVGVIAGGPSHAELLDWLAGEMRRKRWSLKELQRQILLSAVYRQTSIATNGDEAWPTRLQRDPDGRLYSRFPRHRLDGETIRDCMLAVAGLLNTQAGGPSVMPPLPESLTGTILRGQWKADTNADAHARRSIYVFARRNLRYPLFEVFDRPDAGASCPQRDRSTTAIQSLQMLNSELSLQCAVALRNRWQETFKGPPGAPTKDDVDRLFMLALARSPTASEITFMLEFLGEGRLEAEHAACLALLNASEFIYVD